MPKLADEESKGHLANIHDKYRTVALNKKYYGWRLQRLQLVNRILDILIVMGTTGSGVAGLAVWQLQYGQVAWAVINTAAIFISAIKPVLDLPKTIERYGKLVGEHAALLETYRTMEQDIWATQCLTSEQLETFTQLRKRSAELAQLDDVSPVKKLIVQARMEVNQAIPPTSLWMPA